jgi:hypothetical protein
MKIKNYKFAGIEFQFSIPENKMYNDERNLKEFQAETVENPLRFDFELVDNIDGPQGECITVQPNFRIYRDGGQRIRYVGPVSENTVHAYARVIGDGKNHLVQLKKDNFSDKIWTHVVLEMLGCEHLIAQNNGAILHCSYIDCGGKAILFTAPSETGKSTQADLWNLHRGAEIVNGDRAAIRLIDGRLFAEGIPYSGSSKYCKNRTLPVEAIVYLAQAPDTSIRRLNGYQAFSKIWEGLSVNTWEKSDMEKVSLLVKNAAETVPVYYLSCTPDESAVTALEKMLEGEL